MSSAGVFKGYSDPLRSNTAIIYAIHRARIRAKRSEEQERGFVGYKHKKSVGSSSVVYAASV